MASLRLVLPALLLLATAAAASGQEADTTRLGLDPAVRMATLPNGLRYYIRANRQPDRRAELRLVVNAGSVLEDEDQRGLAHVVEHMAFNGTARFPKQALVDFIEGVGMRFGAHLNASTSFDETVYELQVPTDSTGILPRALDVLQDWAQAVEFEPEEVERERGVVIEEWRLGLGASSRILNRQLPVLFHGSRYAERLPIGDRRTLEIFSRDALVRFYRDWYRPDLMAVIAVGDFDADSVEGMVRERFSTLAGPAAPRPRLVIPVPVVDTALVAVATDPEAPGSRAGVTWRIPAREEGTVAAYRAALVERLRDRMLGDRLAELTTRSDPPFIGAGAGRSSFVRGLPVYSAAVAVADGGLERGVGAVMTEVERASRFGFTATEFERARTELLRGYERAWAERDKTTSMAYVGEYVRHFLEGEPAPGIEAEYDLVRRLLPGIALEEVSAAARQPLSGRGLVLLVSAPEKPGLAVPDGRRLLALVGEVARA
ncbi:MAG TPA: pitrilysin family protein, partial [Gemmatimonadales bacterium]|nr:pitrilysin family protein [Gemmatimonadales bacterium]